VARVSKRSRYSTSPQRASKIAILLFKGVVAGLGVAIIGSILLSLASLTTDNVFIEEYNRYIMIGITVVSIFVGSAYAARKAGSHGIMIGITVGILYVLITIAIGMEISQDSPALLILTNKFVAGIAAGALGGMVGVNL